MLWEHLRVLNKENVAKAFGVPPEIIANYDTLKQHATNLATAAKAVADTHGGFTNEDLTRLQGVKDAYNKLKGHIANSTTELGRISTSVAVTEFNTLRTSIEGVKTALEGISHAMGSFTPSTSSIFSDPEKFLFGPEGVQGLLNTLQANFSRIKQLFGSLLSSIVPSAGAAESDGSGLKIDFNVEQAIGKLNQVKEAIIELQQQTAQIKIQINSEQAIASLNSIKEAFLELQQQFGQQLTITVDVSGLLNSINNAKQAMLDLNVVNFSELTSSLNNVINRFQEMAQAAQQAAQAAQQAAQAQSSSNSGGIPFARGGLFRGRPGRDTNLAWLTNFEYVMQPEAVQKYGVALMHMINSLQFPLGGFGLGGLVVPRMAAIPAFAGGGFNGGSRPAQRVLNLTIEGKSFPGLFVPENTAQALERFAVHSQIASAGRKQSWRR